MCNIHGNVQGTYLSEYPRNEDKMEKLRRNTSLSAKHRFFVRGESWLKTKLA